MLADKTTFNTELAGFLDASPTPFHAVSAMVTMLESAGFTALQESDHWDLSVGGKHYVVRNGSSIIAFIVGSEPMVESGINMVGAHTDSPCLMVKPQPEINTQGYFQLGIEVYGGALLNPWFDRDLSIAGRLVYTNAKGELKQTLIDFERPIATIPSLAIHLDREANSGRSINPQTDITPILLQADPSGTDKNRAKLDFRQFLTQQFLNSDDSVVDYDLCFYDTQKAAIIGLDDQFIASARLDNLLSCFVGCKAITSSDTERTCMLVCNDHEEVGSASACGADGPFLETVCARLCEAQAKATVVSRVVSQSLMISCDNAHGVHPNFARKHDSLHLPQLNGGPVIKSNVKQRYATNSVTSSLFKQLCQQAGVPTQSFVSRNDMGCGSTIGPITAARLGVPTLDVGIPQLGMHSPRELAGAEDPVHLCAVLQAFFNSPVNDVAVVDKGL